GQAKGESKKRLRMEPQRATIYPLGDASGITINETRLLQRSPGGIEIGSADETASHFFLYFVASFLSAVRMPAFTREAMRVDLGRTASAPSRYPNWEFGWT
ncbi:MAG: hypothetical protein JWN40_5267, partial [Phycisphaerales bacterium]|nr:hypothetical protein [Phycisphaerales bacterium]